MGLMDLKLATLNVRVLRDSSKFARLLVELKNLSVHVAAVQEIPFICAADCRCWRTILKFSQHYGIYCSAGVSLLVGRSLDIDVDVVFCW